MGVPGSERAAVAAELTRFAARVRTRHVGGAALHAAFGAALALLAPVLVLAWLAPPWRGPLALGTAGCLALAAAGAAWRARRLADATLLRLAAAAAVADPRACAELGDELATWLEVARRGPTAAGTVAMHGWLGDDVAARLRALPGHEAHALGRRQLGARLWLVPLLLFLVLAWWLAALLAPPWSGVLGGGADRPLPNARGAGPGDGAGGGGEGGAGGEAPPPPPPPSAGDRREVPPPPAGPEAKPEPPVAESPLLELPTQQHFVVPEFVGDGPTRRARVHAAEVEAGAPAGSAARRTGEQAPVPLPPPDPTRFQRAAEAAAAARHVPPAERAIVQRYFEALQKAAK